MDGERDHNNPKFSPWVSMPATITAGIAAVSIIAAFLLYQRAGREATAQQASNVARTRTVLVDVLATTIGRMEDLATSATEHWPTRPQFGQLGGGVLQTQAFLRVGLVRYLTASERPAFERAHGPIKDYRSGSRGRLTLERAPLANGYFVLVANVQRSGGGPHVPVGVDIGTEEQRHLALLAAAASGRPQATVPVSPVNNPASQPSLTAIYAPVYRSGMPRATDAQRLAALQGFVSGGYRYSMLMPLLESKLPGQLPFALREGQSTLFSAGRLRSPMRATVPLAGRYWTVAVGRRPLDLSLVYDVLIVGGTLTLLFGVISMQAYRRERLALALIEQGDGERQSAETALATAEERFRTAFSEAPIGMALMAPDGRMLQVNRALARITGYEEQQLLRLTTADLTHPDDRRADELAVTFMLAGELRVYDVEKRLIDANGEVIWTSVHTTLVRDPYNKPTYFLYQLEDISARRRYESRLQHMADHDPLTGLLNRRAYERALEEHLATHPRGEGAVLVVDLDDFKQVNDTLGHNAGDDLIVRVAGALRARLRSEDVIARLGGDEFAILLRTGGPQDVRKVAGSLLDTVRAQRAARGPGGRERPVSASIGIVPLADTQATSPAEALTAADLAMYDAKEAGRDRCETYGFSVDENGVETGSGSKARIETRLEWVERIRAALDEERLVLYAQPVVQTASGVATQHELLIRMLEVDGTLIEPNEFLPIAERYGLIREIDRWVIANAIATLGRQVAEGRSPIVEINLSGQSLGDPELAEMVGSALAEAEVDPRQLIFEVTETAAIGNISAARGCAERMRALGCRFALDDFGAGFGSFYYLKHLPFDFIKIDGEFVRSCTTNPTDRLVIEAVVALARGMSKQTIAEFVHDEQTLTTVRELGVDYAQGFHLGRPVPLSSWFADAVDAATCAGGDSIAAAP